MTLGERLRLDFEIQRRRSMLKRFGTHLRGNVVGYVALFVVLGGSAVALPGKGVIDKNDLRKNVVKAKNIKANAVTNPKIATNAVTGAKVNESTLSFSCTNGRTQFNHLCFETALRAADSWEGAFSDCEDEGGQLPSLAELGAAEDALGFTAGTPDLWAGQSWDDGAERASAFDVSAGIPLRQAANTNHQYVCAFPLFN
jgi:hypothetical protein